MDWNRLFAVDPSLTCSGWALLSLKNDTLLGAGKLRALPPSLTMGERLADLQSRIDTLFVKIGLSTTDVVICEAATTMRDPHSAFKVEQVRCIFESLARSRGVAVPGRINPRSVHGEMLGMRGRQLKREIVKEAAVDTVHHLYGEALRGLGVSNTIDELKKHQDLVDAILVGRLGSVRIREAFHAGVTLSTMFETRRRMSSITRR